MLAFFTLIALPANANAPCDGVKKEIVKANAFDFNVSMEVSLKVPQFLFDNCSVYRSVELWNYSFQKTPADLKVKKKEKNQFYNWRYTNSESVSLKTNFKHQAFTYIDPGSLFYNLC
jgi:hypothetical protein